MAYTMFNQQPCKIHSSERHNTREQKLDYIFPELSHNNESFYFDDRGLTEIYDECKQLYEEKVKRKFQEKTAPIREGVVLIDEHTTLDDVKRLAEELGKLLKWKPLQVHIHRDEGHKLSPDNKEGSEVAELNLHAHIVFDTQDKETGKMNNSGKENLSTAQDICARELRMERGKPSTKKHLDALSFKIKKQEERIQALMAENQNLTTKNEELNKIQSDGYKKLTANNNLLKILNEQIEGLEKKKEEAKKEYEKKSKEYKENLEKDIAAGKKRYEEETKQAKKELEDANKELEEVNSIQWELVEKEVDLEDKIKKKKAEFEYLCGAGEMEDLASRFVEVARNNKAYTGMTWDEARDELHDMIDKKIDKELQQGGNTLRR